MAVEQAKAAYNAARDRVAEQLAVSPKAKSIVTLHNEEAQIREKARLLWELSGKPQNSAEADWLLAERLVRSAAAA
ncbi:MAG: DUF2934 domain-containing protein [Acidobacteriota bacterium]|nr:DUF2934 domain-containing protein [Acidobacteriota bacterium]